MRSRLLILCAVMFALICTPGITLGADEAKPITYNEPLAYIGWDGNVWITDIKSGAGTPITSDGAEGRYSSPQWSPSGDMLLVSVYADPTPFFYIFKSGQPPMKLEGNPPGIWSVDGKSIVYSYLGEPCYSSEETNISIEAIDIASNKVHTVAYIHCQITAIGEGPFYPYMGLLMRERYGRGDPEAGWFETPNFLIIGTPHGYLYIKGHYVGGEIEMISSDGKVSWSGQFERIGLSPSRNFAYAAIADEDHNKIEHFILDLSNGKLAPLASAIPDCSGPGGGAYALTADKKTLLCSTLRENNARYGDRDLWDYSKLTLWRVPLDTGKPAPLFTRTGYAIGIVAPTPSGKGAVVSLVTSTALFGNKGRPKIAEGRPHVELLYVDLKTGATRVLALGGQPAVGTKPFTAIPAKPRDK